jgi:hypothetical protein
MVFAETDRKTDPGILITRKHKNLQVEKMFLLVTNGISPQKSKYKLQSSSEDIKLLKSSH